MRSACATFIAIGLPRMMCLPARARPRSSASASCATGAARWTMSIALALEQLVVVARSPCTPNVRGERVQLRARCPMPPRRAPPCGYSRSARGQPERRIPMTPGRGWPRAMAVTIARDAAHRNGHCRSRSDHPRKHEHAEREDAEAEEHHARTPVVLKMKQPAGAGDRRPAPGRARCGTAAPSRARGAEAARRRRSAR